MKPDKFVVRRTQLVLSSWIVFFALLLLNGYTLNLVGFPANPDAIFAMIVVEGGLGAVWILRQGPTVTDDPLELAGFTLVVVSTGLYFVYPSWPTLLPPSYSGDAAVHSSTALSIFYSGRIVGDLPGGPPLIAATLAHWVGWSPLRVLHPLGALWIALTAGGIYGLACTLLPDRREFKTLALFAPFALYVPWDYFVGTLIFTQYFWTQVAGQLYLVAFVWFLISYLESHQYAWVLGMALCLVSISVSHQFLLPLPYALFAWAIFRDWLKDKASCKSIRCAALTVVGVPALLWLAIFLAGGYFVPDPVRVRLEGPLLSPSLEAFGGVFLILPVLGLFLAMRSKDRTESIIALLVLAVLQTLALVLANRLIGVGTYWVRKSFFPYIFPFALFTVFPFARLLEWTKQFLGRHILSSVYVFISTFAALATTVVFVHPPLSISLLSESDIQVALWAREHLDTRHIQYIGPKSVTAAWTAVGIWGEHFPDDLGLGLVALGPRTFEDWRYDSSWGEYLFISSNQRHPLDPATHVVYQRGDSAIVQKPPTLLPISTTAPLPRFDNIFSLIDYDLPKRTFHTGEVISLTAHLGTWQAPRNQVVWRLQLRDLQNNAVAEKRIAPFDDKYPFQRWPDQVILAQLLTLPLPVDIQPGLYDLQLGLYQVGDGEPQRFTTTDGTQDDVSHLGRVKIPVPPVTTDELSTITPTNSRIGNKFTLLGYRGPGISPLRPGDSLKLFLYWQCVAPVSEDYTVFVHLLDVSGALRAQRDAAPRDGTYPTSIWETGEIIVDSYTLTIPHDAVPGDYFLEVGMYQWPSLTRLLVTGQDGHKLGDRILLPEGVRVAAN